MIGTILAQAEGQSLLLCQLDIFARCFGHDVPTFLDAMLEEPSELVLDIQVELVRLGLNEAQLHLEPHVVIQEPA